MSKLLLRRHVLPGILHLHSDKLLHVWEIEVLFRYCEGALERVENKTHGRLFPWLGQRLGELVAGLYMQNRKPVNVGGIFDTLVNEMNEKFGDSNHYVFEKIGLIHAHPPSSIEIDPDLARQLEAFEPSGRMN